MTIKVGDQVRVECEGTVEYIDPTQSQIGVRRGGVMHWVTREDAHAIPRSIVLPTGKNALIQIGNLVLRNTDHYQYPWKSDSVVYTVGDILAWAQSKPEAYRVIFEGEND